jgi:hypothetical protein
MVRPLGNILAARGRSSSQKLHSGPKPNPNPRPHSRRRHRPPAQSTIQRLQCLVGPERTPPRPKFRYLLTFKNLGKS